MVKWGLTAGKVEQFSFQGLQMHDFYFTFRFLTIESCMGLHMHLFRKSFGKAKADTSAYVLERLTPRMLV